jgi:hypothetical protein
MCQEYAIGLFSVKYNSFSFDVLVLKIVSGKKNRKFIHRDDNINLLGHVGIVKHILYSLFFDSWGRPQGIEMVDSN